MDHTEEMGYVRMSGPGASFAFHKDAGETIYVNLHWLADVIRHYEAGERKLTIPAPDDEQAAARELEILRPAVQRVDSEKYEEFTRAHGRRQ